MVFWRSFGFYDSNISALFLFSRGDTVKILCSRWKHPWRCSNRFWSGQPWDFKMVGCGGFSADQAFEKIEFS